MNKLKEKGGILLLGASVLLILFFIARAGKANYKAISAALGAGQSTAASDSLPLTNKIPADVIPQKVSAINFKGEIDFAGEKVPFKDFDVIERLERELLVNMYWHSSTIYTFKLSGRYFDEMERVLKENGVPDDFKFLAMAESSLRNQRSPAGAVGIWQFLKSTGVEYGLEINNDVDERYDYIKSCEAACKYLNKQYKKFGSWTLAAAAYNRGSRGISDQIAAQGVESYYDLYLNSETSRYVFRIMALKEIYNNPEKYGFYISEEDYYDPVDYKMVEIDSSINDLAKYAKDNGTTYKMLKLMNPWLRSTDLTNTKKKTYQIKLPG